MSKSTAPSFLALSCVGAIAFATSAHAQEAEQGRKLGGMTVTDTAIDTPKVKVERAESPKYTSPLADTPQTITVISKASIQQQNLLTLREVLSTVPGITFGAGEGGFGYGDRITLLGQDAKNDVTIDGVRSAAVLSRNETYNIEQVEITTGANSVYNGGGSVAGTINLVTKRPMADTQVTAQAGVGTDNYWRGTIDANYRLSDLVAVRVNAVYHQNDVPGRQVEYSDRWGVAPSITIGIDSPTNLTFQYEHLVDHSMPQYGIRYFPALSGYYVNGFNTEGYYGFRNVDKQNSETDMLQSIFNHEFSDTLRIRNLVKYENIQQDTVTSQPAGTYCLPDGTNPAGGACTSNVFALAAGTTQPFTVPAGYYLPTGSRGNQRFIRNETTYEQFDIIGKLNTGGIEHDFVIGGSYLWQKFTQNQGSILRTAAGFDPYAAPFTTTGTPATVIANPMYNAASSLGFYYPLTSIGDPSTVITGPAAAAGTLARTYGNNVYNGPINFIQAQRQKGTQTSLAAYFFDTAKLTDWLQINGGVRYEHVVGRNRTTTYSTVPGATLGTPTLGTPTRISNDLFSFRVGVVAKPLPNVSLYVAHGTSKLPSQASVNDSCAASTTNGASNCNVNPQTTRNYEIGAKAELFDKQLLLSAAIFRNDRDYLVTQASDVGTADQQSDGEARSQGFSLGASGNITPNWTISANYMYLDAHVRKGGTDACIANPTRTGCPTAIPIAGSELNNAPEHSGSIFTSYRFPFGLELGYGLTYQGSFALNQPTLQAPATILYRVPSYTTQRLTAAYTINDHVTAQVNVQNLFNERYVTTVRNNVTGSWAQPGATRSAVFSLIGTF